jgi:hypothetical protein
MAPSSSGRSDTADRSIRHCDQNDIRRHHHRATALRSAVISNHHPQHTIDVGRSLTLSAPHRRLEPVALSAGRARRPIAHVAGPKRAGPSGLYAAVDRAGVALASTPYLTTQQVRPVADLIIAK